MEIIISTHGMIVDSAAKSGAEIAVPPMELPGYGLCAIVIQNGLETGYWQI